MLDSPIKWIGGKRILRKDIIPLIPKCDCYVEVFGGAGWVLFGKEPKYHKVEVYNDINSDVTNFFRVVRDKYDEFEKYFQYMLVSREEFDNFKFQDILKLNDVEKAFRFWYMLKYSYGGKKNRLSDYSFGYSKNRKPPLPIKQKDLIDKCYERLQGVYIENLSYEILIKKYDSESTIFFLDPPYLDNDRVYGEYELPKEKHIELKEILSNIKGRWILTVNDNEFFRELYKDFNIINTEVNYSAGNATGGNGKRKELIIKNY